MIIGSMTGRELFEIFKKDKPMLEKFAIYYLSKRFTDCESRYSLLEKT